MNEPEDKKKGECWSEYYDRLYIEAYNREHYGGKQNG